MSNQSRWPALLAGKRRRGVFLVLTLAAVLAGTMTPLLFSSDRIREAPPGDQPPAPAAREQAEPAPPNLSAMIRRLVLGTVAVLLLSTATLWGCARFLQRVQPPRGGQMEILARLAVDRRSQVFLVRVAGQRLLAAVDVNGLKALVPVSGAAEATPESTGGKEAAT